MRNFLVLGTIAAAGLAVGCVSAPKLDFDVQRMLKRAPTRMAISVTPNHIERDGMPFHQGMFARIHFFVGDEPIPTAATGDVELLAYDRGKYGDAPNPVGQYVIPAAELEKHRRKDLVGTSYVFWLPYNPDKSTQMLVTANFKPTHGASFAAPQTMLHLAPLKRALPGEAMAATRRHLPQYTMIDAPRPQAQTGVANIPLRNQPVLPRPHDAYDPQVLPAGAVAPQSGYAPADGLPERLPFQPQAAPLPLGETASPQLSQ